VQSSAYLTEEAWAVLSKSKGNYSSPEWTEAHRKAEELFRKAAEQSPLIGRYRLNVARALTPQGRWEEAYNEALLALPHCQPDDVLPYEILGTICINLKKWDEAVGYARKGSELDPRDPAHLERLARASVELGATDQAIEAWAHRLDDFPTTPATRVLAGEDAARLGRYDKTVEWFATTAELGQLKGSQWLLYALALVATGQPEQAVNPLSRYYRETKRDLRTAPDITQVRVPVGAEAGEALATAYRRMLMRNPQKTEEGQP
jgi:tetratricopeptide (TPR) repeat protein